ncbi:MAG: GldG family protein [Lachnospiraceae bacterium]|nr:GldG family protein [Lachnospiraceae bacterium]
MKKHLNSFETRSLRIGGYSVIATVVVIAIVVLMNVGVAILPEAITKFDLTKNSVYEISEQSRTILQNLDMDVTAYWIVAEGKEDITIQNFLDRYQSLSSHLNVVKIDPDEDPSFAKRYEIENVTDNTLLVESAKRHRYIAHSQIYKTAYVADDTAESGVALVTTFEGDAVMTSAVSYVVNDVLPVAYRLTGHGEVKLETAYSQKVELDNIKMPDLSLTTAGAVPDDCDLLVILNPKTDISEEEKGMIEDYLNKGGDLLLITTPTQQAGVRDRLGELMAEYGLSEVPGMVIDPNPDYYLASQNSMFLLPKMELHRITQPLRVSNYKALFAAASGLQIAETLPSDIDADSLLTTSEDSFAKVNISKTTVKEEGDTPGPFSLGAISVKELPDHSESRVVWYTSVGILDPTASAVVSGANENLFLNTLDYLTDLPDIIGIHGKTISSDYLTVPASAKNLWMVILIGVIPACVIIAGIIVTVRRRMR